MSDNEVLSASLEDYLETIYHIVSEKQAARAKNIADILNVNNSSVTGALRSLSEKGFINYQPYDLITLTSKGKKLAEDIVRRHEGLKDFLTRILKVPTEEANEAACKLEHAISPEILDRLIRFTEFIEICPRAGESWLAEFWHKCETDCNMTTLYQDCKNCFEKAFNEYAESGIENSRKSELLSDITKGAKGKIIKIKGRGKIKKQLAELNIVPGDIAELEDNTSGDDYIDVKIKGYHLAIRKDDAQKIEIEILE